MIDCWRRFAHHPQVSEPLAPTAPAQGESFFAVAPFDALVIYHHALAPHYPIQHRAAPAPSRLGQCPQTLPQLVVTIRAGPATKRASRNSDQPAGATLRQMMARYHFRYHLSLHRGP
jgi:hypothetical protein